MKKYVSLFVFCCAVFAAPHGFAADTPATAATPAPVVDDAKTQEERGIVASSLFQQACFMNFGHREKAVEFLDKNFPRHDADKKKAFLDFVQASDGDVWGAVFPKGAFVVVLESSGNCHVIAQKADGATIHDQLKKLADAAGKNLKEVKIKYNAPGKHGPLTSSGFEVQGPSGRNLIVVAATTMKDPPPVKPAAIITMAVRAQPPARTVVKEQPQQKPAAPASSPAPLTGAK